ncbi:MAG: hypothetical protein ACRDJH_07695 [Thermomicrobiales bacterium]
MQATARQSLANNHLRITLAQDGTGYALDVLSGAEWQSLGRGTFGRLVSLDASGSRQETPIQLTEVDAAGDHLHLSGSWADADGLTWRFSHEFHLTPNPRQVEIIARAAPSAPTKVLHFSGPTFLAGEGSFGARKTDGLFPGLEYLTKDEPSSSTAFASENYAGRAVPHPYKIAVPMMAVAHEGLTVGLIWDPNQDYGSAWRHPAAVFSSPNRLDDADHHLLGLFAPGVPRFVEENAREATKPIGASPTNPLRIEARLVALTGATSIDVLKVWVDTYGLPEIEPPHAYAENVDLCVRSYVDVAWDENAEAWHHTLADPWGPRYEPRVIAQLWRYGQWPAGDSALRARARDQVRRGLERARKSGPGTANPQNRPSAPHLELALHYGQIAESLAGTKRQVDELLAAQQSDGSWPWRPDLIAHASYNTDERRKVMGGEESSTGLTADRAHHLLAWARMTGDEACREAGLRAVAWCNAQTRPEGAQTWELHLHVPDILAAPYLVDVNLAAHHLTGDDSYLAEADRWAWTGLPFTYLWRAYYRPIMAYCTVPVFGVTFHDVQSWFGVDVHWNGLVYADALCRLAATTGEERWRQIALGIVACGMQQQPTAGPWLGMYPDAVSLVRGEEEYTWWLNPNLIGLNTFELAGIPLDVTTTTLESHAASNLVTSGATVVEAKIRSDGLRLILDYPPGETSHTLIGGLGKPSRVLCEGLEIGSTDDVESVARGWQWLADHGLAVVKTLHGSGGAVAVDVIAE